MRLLPLSTTISQTRSGIIRTPIVRITAHIPHVPQLPIMLMLLLKIKGGLSFAASAAGSRA
jgi:hypothetical protein